jgi:hypothetical protein
MIHLRFNTMTWLQGRRRWLIRGSMILLFLAVGAAMLFCAPFYSKSSLCRVCGRDKDELSILYIPCWKSEYDTSVSEWYRDSGLRPHAHEWVFLCSAKRQWCGNVIDTDSFGWVIIPLRRFREVSPKMDKNTFDAFAKKYEATLRDGATTRAFLDELETISPSPRRQNNDSADEDTDEE